MEPLDVLQSYRCPRYLEYPSVPLYKDQVIGFLTQAVAPFYGAEQTPVTAAMINEAVNAISVLYSAIAKPTERASIDVATA